MVNSSLPSTSSSSITVYCESDAVVIAERQSVKTITPVSLGLPAYNYTWLQFQLFQRETSISQNYVHADICIAHTGAYRINHNFSALLVARAMFHVFILYLVLSLETKTELCGSTLGQLEHK